MHFNNFRKMQTMELTDREIWFIHLNYDPPLPLRFQRTQGLGARVTGGKSGSHFTGHGETYWDKLVEIVRLGYVPATVAKEIRVLEEAWTPPNPEELDERIQRGDFELKKTTIATRRK